MLKTTFAIRHNSNQGSVLLNENARISEVLDALRKQQTFKDLPQKPNRVYGYSSGKTFELSENAPSNEVIIVE